MKLIKYPCTNISTVEEQRSIVNESRKRFYFMNGDFVKCFSKGLLHCYLILSVSRRSLGLTAPSVASRNSEIKAGDVNCSLDLIN